MKISSVIRTTILLILGAAWILPLYLFLINAATDPKEFGKKEKYQLPTSFALWANMNQAWEKAHLGQAVFSTVFYSVVGAVLACLLSGLAAYAIVSLKIRWGFFWFIVIYAGTIFPFQMYLSPLYSMYINWSIGGYSLYNTHIGLLVLYTAIAIPFATFVIRNHFTSIPHDLAEAARLDGASAMRVFATIFIPLSMNAFATIFILQFTWIWNDLLFGLTLSRSENIRPIMTALAALQGQYASSGPPIALAGALIVSIPTFVLFFAVQRVFERGLRVTA
jgi:multiple sugar transport system permease protein